MSGTSPRGFGLILGGVRPPERDPCPLALTVLGGVGGGCQTPGAAIWALPAQRPAKRSKCRQLFRSPSMPSSVIRPILKRIDRPPDRDTPVKTKRRRSVAGTPGEEAAAEPVGDEEGFGVRGPCCGTAPALPAPSLTPGWCLGFASPQKARLLRSRSFCHEEIENLLASDHRELIGDFSKVGLLGVLPPFPNKAGAGEEGAVSGALCPCKSPNPAGGPLRGDKGTWGCDFPACRPRGMRGARSLAPAPYHGHGSLRGGPQSFGEWVMDSPGQILTQLHPLSSRLTSCRRWRGSTRT